MANSHELKIAEYKNLLFLLQNPRGFPPEDLQRIRTYVTDKIRKDCQEHFKKVTGEMGIFMQFYDELCDTDPTDMSVMYENVTSQAFYYASRLSVGMNHLNELRQYLRELDQLDK